MDGSVAVERMASAIRVIAAGQAELMSALVQIAEETPVPEFAPMEIAAGATWTRQAASAQLVLAYQLVERLPAVHAALAAGDIDLPKARVIIDGVSVVSTAIARHVCELVLPHASALTTGQIRALLEKLVIEADPDAAVKRHRHKVSTRRVVFESAGDGCANVLGLDFPADKARAAANRINALARMAKISGDPRTADQLRADTMMSLLLGGSAGRVAANGGVEITASLQTLSRLADSPGDLHGYGPVVADIARQVAAQQRDGKWSYSVRDAETGDFYHGTTRARPALPDDGAGSALPPPREGPVRNRVASPPEGPRERGKRNPSAAMVREVRMRDRTCRAPGCRVPATHCDLDHVHDWARGGPTAPCNLAALCRYHHRAKHDGYWTLVQTRTGFFTWRSPLGRIYKIFPEPPP